MRRIPESSEKVNWIMHYMRLRRGVGHTKAMIEGCQRNDTIIIAHTQHYADQLAIQWCGRNPARKYSFGIDNPDLARKLRGIELPITIDHHAIELVAYQLLQENAYLRSRLMELLERNDLWTNKPIHPYPPR